MINLNLAEPPVQMRDCVYCGKKKNLTGALIHIPNAEYTKPTYKIITGHEIESFSLWLYTCSWCKGIRTKEKNKQEAHNANS